MSSASATPLHALPISQRPPRTWARIGSAVLFCLLFNLGCLLINGSQFVFLLPLRLLPFRWSRRLYYAGIRYTKGAFGALQSTSCAILKGCAHDIPRSNSPHVLLVRTQQAAHHVRDAGHGRLHA